MRAHRIAPITSLYWCTSNVVGRDREPRPDSDPRTATPPPLLAQELIKPSRLGPGEVTANASSLPWPWAAGHHHGLRQVALPLSSRGGTNWAWTGESGCVAQVPEWAAPGRGPPPRLGRERRRGGSRRPGPDRHTNGRFVAVRHGTTTSRRRAVEARRSPWRASRLPPRASGLSPCCSSTSR